MKRRLPAPQPYGCLETVPPSTFKVKPNEMAAAVTCCFDFYASQWRGGSEAASASLASLLSESRKNVLISKKKGVIHLMQE